MKLMADWQRVEERKGEATDLLSDQYWLFASARIDFMVILGLCL